MKMSVHIVYEQEGVKPTSILRIDSNEILKALAGAAIQKEKLKAAQIREMDELLGSFQDEQVKRLVDFLCMVVPGLQVEEGKGIH